jgi:XXXCH domain-containing protein
MAKIDKKRSVLLDQKYRPLKKMLKKNSRIISDCLVSQQLPPAVVMDDFMAQVKVMVSYPGFGDEYYAAFLVACEALYQAHKEKDPALFVEHFSVIISLKKQCHHRYNS